MMDIHSKGKYPCNALSNFAVHPFVIDGVECASMEGWLQSLKFDKPHIQVEVCKLTGMAAKKRGSSRNDAWKRLHTLWWRGKIMSRFGEEYQELLTRAYDALAENDSFRRALLSTRDATLTHVIGSTKQKDTVLTASEFCNQLYRLREKLQNDDMV